MNKIDTFIKLLEKVSYILKENNIPFYIDCGTLLGCIRNKKLIENDTDVDITTHLLFWNKLKYINFAKYDLIVTRKLEDFPYKPHGNMISVRTKYNNYYCDIATNPAFPKLSYDTLYNNIYPIPLNPELYLEQLYGKNWKIPSNKHASVIYIRNNGLVFSNYKYFWNYNYPIYKCLL